MGESGPPGAGVSGCCVGGWGAVDGLKVFFGCVGAVAGCSGEIAPRRCYRTPSAIHRQDTLDPRTVSRNLSPFRCISFPHRILPPRMLLPISFPLSNPPRLSICSTVTLLLSPFSSGRRHCFCALQLPRSSTLERRIRPLWGRAPPFFNGCGLLLLLSHIATLTGFVDSCRVDGIERC